MTDRLPGWRVDLPPSWARQRTADALVASGGATASGVRPHIVVALENLSSALPLEAVATRAGAALVDLADGQSDAVDDLGVTRTCDESLERVVRVVGFEARRVRVDVAVVLAFLARPPAGEPHRDVLQVVGSCALDDLDRCAPEFAAVIGSARPRALAPPPPNW
jgi:hypothetical protein